jgi:16S rRNA (uracil1498-N3)-methyltransferase
LGRTTSFLLSQVLKGDELRLDEALLGKVLTQHLKALRLEKGERADFMDGQGRWAECVCEGSKPWSFRVEGLRSQAALTPRIELCLAPPKKDALWESLAQATEMGASSVRFVESEHSQHRKQDREALIDRARRVADAACEQSHRAWRLEIADDWLSLESALALPGTQIVADEGLAEHGGLGFTKPIDAARLLAPEGLRLFIGPEGGWSQAERTLLLSKATALGLGAQVLRVPTAVVAALHHLKCAAMGVSA